MPRFLLAAAMAWFGAPCFAMPAAPPPESPGKAPCSISAATGGDIRVVTCTLAPGADYRLTFRFRGGHDDTSASMSASLDGQPFDCSAESKTRLFGEDGDVELYCRAHIVGDAGASRTLVATVLWSHAQYRDFTFSAE